MKVPIITKNYYLLFLFVNLFTLVQICSAGETNTAINNANSIRHNEQLQYKIDNLIKNYSISNEQTAYSNASVIQKAAVSQFKVLHQILTSNLDKITLHLSYWKTVELSTIKHFITNPINAFSGKKSIQTHIESLESEQAILATHLGHLKRAFDQDLSKDNNVFFLINLIHYITERQRSFERTENSIAIDQALKEVDENFELLAKFKVQEENNISLHAKPSHFTRNCIKYTAGAVGLLFASDFIYRNSSQIPLWQDQAIDAISRFWQQRIVNPIANSWSILFLNRKNANINLITHQNSVAKAIKNHFSESLTPEQIQSAIELAQAGNTPPIVLSDLNEKINASGVTNLLNVKKIMSLINIIVQIDKILIHREHEAFKNKQDLTLELAAIVPAAGLFGVSAYILHKIYSAIAPQKNIQRPIKFTLRNIENILNKSQHQEQLTAQEEGFIIYYAHHLKSYIDWIPSKERPLFLEDVCQLESSEFSIAQKIAVVERINRTYPFLNEIIK